MHQIRQNARPTSGAIDDRDRAARRSTIALVTHTLILIVFLFNYCLSVFSLLKLIRLLDLHNVIRILKVPSFLLFNALCEFFDFFLFFFELIFSLRFNLYLDDDKDFYPGFCVSLLFYSTSIWNSPLIPTVIVKLQTFFSYNTIMWKS